MGAEKKGNTQGKPPRRGRGRPRRIEHLAAAVERWKTYLRDTDQAEIVRRWQDYRDSGGVSAFDQWKAELKVKEKDAKRFARKLVAVMAGYQETENGGRPSETLRTQLRRLRKKLSETDFCLYSETQARGQHGTHAPHTDQAPPRVRKHPRRRKAARSKS